MLRLRSGRGGAPAISRLLAKLSLCGINKQHSLESFPSNKQKVFPRMSDGSLFIRLSAKSCKGQRKLAENGLFCFFPPCQFCHLSWTKKRVKYNGIHLVQFSLKHHLFSRGLE